MLLTCGTVTSSIAPGFIIRYTSLINPTRSAICSKQWFDFMISTLFSAKGSKTESRLHTTSVAAVFIMSTPNSSRTFLPPHPRFSIITLPPPPHCQDVPYQPGFVLEYQLSCFVLEVDGIIDHSLLRWRWYRIVAV